MKPQHFAALAGSLLLVALVLLFTGRPEATKSDTQPVQAAPRSITVTGEGEIRVRPDLALVTFGVVTHRASAAEAEALALASARQIAGALTEAGALEDRVEVTHLTLTTNTFTDFAGVTRISGFQAAVAVQATVRNLTKVQAVLDAGLAAGATSLDEVVYTLEGPEVSRQAAMRSALENARQRATMLAKAEGERLGELLSMEVLLEDSPGTANSPANLTFRARVRASFGY